jgi:hypothetical protein
LERNGTSGLVVFQGSVEHQTSGVHPVLMVHQELVVQVELVVHRDQVVVHPEGPEFIRFIRTYRTNGSNWFHQDLPVLMVQVVSSGLQVLMVQGSSGNTGAMVQVVHPGLE